jgi:hypothetical protein
LAAVVWCIHGFARPSNSFGEAAAQYRRAAIVDASAAVSGLSLDAVNAPVAVPDSDRDHRAVLASTQCHVSITGAT